MKRICSIIVSGRCVVYMIAALVMLVQSACRKDRDGATPVITNVRNYAASPADTLVQSVVPGQWIVLIGHNLHDAVAVTFNGVTASIKGNMFSDTSAVIQVPAVIPFPSVPAEQLNVIQYYTTHGSTTFTFNIVAPPPTITSVSNENAHEGDSVYVYGTNFFFVQDVTFADVKVEKFAASTDGTAIGFVLPALSHSGKVKVTTKSGADSTRYNVNDRTTNVLCNFDDINPFSWGTDLRSSSTDFPGNWGTYAILKNGVLSGGDGTWWGSQRSINTNEVHWLPVDSLNVPVDAYALKFEISVPEAWNGTTLYAIRNYDRAYMARYEPWLAEGGATAAYSTKGWRTVTIPFTSFRTNDGKGTSAPNLAAVVGATASGPINIQTANFGAGPTATGFYAAIDNIRIVKIK